MLEHTRDQEQKLHGPSDQFHVRRRRLFSLEKRKGTAEALKLLDIKWYNSLISAGGVYLENSSANVTDNFQRKLYLILLKVFIALELVVKETTINTFRCDRLIIVSWSLAWFL